MVRMMAPFTPFLTELMYKQLRKIVLTLSGPNSVSVYYLMLPTAMEDLIYEDVESFVVHKDQQCLDDIQP